MLTTFEYPSSPVQLFLRDWPANWFEPVAPIGPVANDLLRAIGLKWNQLLIEAQARVGRINEQEITQQTQVLTPPLLSQTATSTPRHFLLWDEPQARNFFYRRSPNYESAMLGWQALAAKQNHSWEVTDKTSLNDIAIKKDSVLLIPDIRFLTTNDLDLLQEFVENGGILVFSKIFDNAEHADTGLGKEASNRLSESLKKLGSNRIQKGFYSPIQADYFLNNTVTVEHAVIDSEWLRAMSFGSGAIVFLGFQPLDSASQSVVKSVIGRLQGDTLDVPISGPGCATALFVFPYGNKNDLTSFADGVRALGLDLKWLVDPVSLAHMMPNWQSRFSSDGVVFLDDDKASTRLLAAELWAKLKGPTEPLFFSKPGSLQTGFLDGPSSRLFSTILLVENSQNAISKWAAECRTGIAEPRLIDPRHDSNALKQTLSDITHFGPRDTKSLIEYLRRLEQIQSGKADGHRKMHFKQGSPLLLSGDSDEQSK